MRAVVSLALALGGVLASPALSAARAPEGQRFALIVQGASGDPSFATLHRGWLDKLAATLRAKAKLDATHLAVLAEQPGAGEERATAENVKAVLARYATAMKADDLLFIMLIGHGGGDGADAKFNLVGPDLSIAEWNALLKPIPGRIVVVDSTSSSFAYLAGLAAPGRIVITATSSYSQRYHTVFADAFIQALNDSAADADKNGRISILEAFNHASRLVQQSFDQDKRLSTEKAVIDDTGDGAGRDALTTGPDGVVAGVTYLESAEVPKVADPEVQALLVRRQDLTDQVDALKRRKPQMNSEEYDREFEKLIIELSLVSREVRRRIK